MFAQGQLPDRRVILPNGLRPASAKFSQLPQTGRLLIESFPTMAAPKRVLYGFAGRNAPTTLGLAAEPKTDGRGLALTLWVLSPRLIAHLPDLGA